MATLPGWVQHDNDRKTEAARKADAALQRRLQAGEFIRQRGMGYWEQLALALQFNAQGLEGLKGEELYGTVVKSVTGGEHQLHVRVDRRSTWPDSVWLNLWYSPGNGSIRCWYMDKERPNIELVVSGRPDIGQDIVAMYADSPLTADQLGERIIRRMADQVQAK